MSEKKFQFGKAGPLTPIFSFSEKESAQAKLIKLDITPSIQRTGDKDHGQYRHKQLNLPLLKVS